MWLSRPKSIATVPWLVLRWYLRRRELLPLTFNLTALHALVIMLLLLMGLRAERIETRALRVTLSLALRMTLDLTFSLLALLENDLPLARYPLLVLSLLLIRNPVPIASENISSRNTVIVYHCCSRRAGCDRIPWVR